MLETSVGNYHTVEAGKVKESFAIVASLAKSIFTDDVPSTIV
jgi:hypothetical protein